MKITRQLFTGAWTTQVDALQRALEGFTTEGRLTNDCEVACFEIGGDTHLHVNVTHRHPTRPVRGWAGPGRVVNGYVHNRRFGHARRSQIIRDVRAIVLAPRL